MNNKYASSNMDLSAAFKLLYNRLNVQAKRYWLQVAVLLVFAYIMCRKDLTINVSLNGLQTDAAVVFEEEPMQHVAQASSVHPVNISMLEKKAAPAKKRAESIAHDDNAANTFSNLSYTKGKFATHDSAAAREAKKQKQAAYVKRFVNVAQTEMTKFGVPASIILAQGLLESDAGDSRLSTNNNNHFGIKCFSRTCRKGHCSNFTDDSHKDFFRKYQNAWESYRAHSQLLRAPRYTHLYKLGKADYKSWAMGLKRAGYATDKYYGEKLINLIEDLELQEYDR